MSNKIRASQVSCINYVKENKCSFSGKVVLNKELTLIEVTESVTPVSDVIHSIDGVIFSVTCVN